MATPSVAATRAWRRCWRDAKNHYATAKGHARHWNWNLEIDGDGEVATMRCYLLALTVPNAPNVKGGTGIYVDRLRKVGDAWLFEERHITMDG